MLKNKLLEELKNHFGKDKLDLDKNLAVTDYAEKLISLFKEKYPKKDLNEQVIIYFAVLHDLGLKDKKNDSNANILKNLNSSTEAEELMKSLNIESLKIDFEKMKEISEIVLHHHKPGKVSGNNFKILYDSEKLANLDQKNKLEKLSKNEMKKLIEEKLISDIAKDFAQKKFLS